MKKRILFLAALCLDLILPPSLRPASFMPIVKNIVPDIPLSQQTFGGAQDAAGKIYFGARGLIEFDGNEWTNHKIPGESQVRTVKYIGDRIYIGAYEEFGYYKADETGRLVYHSLSKDIPRPTISDCDIWEVAEQGPYVLFFSYNHIFVYDGKSVSTLPLGDRHALGLYKIPSGVLVQLTDLTVHKIGNDLKLTPVFADNRQMPLLLSINARENGDRYYFTSDGYFLVQKNGAPDTTRWSTDADNMLRYSDVQDVQIAGDSLIIISTRRDGVLALDTAGKVQWHHNLRTGLCSNAVLTVFIDSYGNIWCTSDHGLSLIYTSLPLRALIPGPNDPQVGVVNGISKHGDNIYLATSQGGYYLNMKDMSIHEIFDFHDFFWYTNEIGGQVFMGSNAHLAILSGGKNETLFHENTSITQSADKKHYFESNYSGIRVYRAHPDGSIDISSGYMLPGFKATLASVVEDYDGSLWASHIANGVYRLVLNLDKNKILEQQFFPSLKGSGTRHKITPVKLNGRVYLADSDSLYSYSRETGEMVPYRKFCNELPWVKQIQSISEADPHKFWIATADGYYLVNYDGTNYRCDYEIPFNLFSIHNFGLSRNIFIGNENRVYFASTNGILLFDGNISSGRDAIPVLSFSRITAASTPGNEQRLPVSADARPDVDANISFNMALVNPGNKKYRFRYSLEGNTSSEHISDEYSVSYVNLSPGDYTFRADLLDKDNNSVQSLSYDFTVPTPLLLRPWMIVIYILSAILLLYLSTRISLYYIDQRRKKRLREKQMEDNIQSLQQENEAQLKHNQLLEERINDKNKDLATLALNEVERGYRIEELQKALISNKNGVSTGDVEKLLRNIKSDSSDLDFWKILQGNFDLIHNNYFVRLRKKYPSLTSVDLRFCMLLRLNMNTKDIARMTNLSVRGVETARYRLRRKIGLGSKESLTQFLIDFEAENTSDGQNVVKT